MMQLKLPDTDVQMHLSYSNKPKMTPDEFYEFCQANPDLWLELTNEGEIVIMPPAGTEAGFRSGEVFRRLANWADVNGGRAVDASGGFALPDGSVRALDAAWIQSDRLKSLNPAARHKYVPLAPDFVVEVMSPSDRLHDAQTIMEQWMINGVQLAWLIQPEQRAIYIYRQGRSEPELLEKAEAVHGEGPVAGFSLDLRRVWDTLY